MTQLISGIRIVHSMYHLLTALSHSWWDNPESVPLLVPGVTPDSDTGDTPVTQIVVHHPSAVSGMREELAEFLMSHADERGELAGGLLIRHINALGALGLERTLQVVAPGKPRFAVFFTKNPI